MPIKGIVLYLSKQNLESIPDFKAEGMDDIPMYLLIIYIQVVPGQAGGGSFKREKDLYSEERICL